ncbi:hypothetical protein LFM09_37270 [Lentzea alba]|uniref:hypothetical protein n=1 Tax=Lentzea alba TaxID=2714351 RepID=UPI0039BEE2AE
MRLVLVALAVLLTTSCSTAEPSVTPNELFFEYVQSTSVKGDLWAPTASTAEARRQAIVARYSGDQFQRLVLHALECDGGTWPPFFEDRCDRSIAVEQTAAGGRLFSRSVIVKHGDGSLELFVLFVLQRGEESLLVDDTGRTYTDLENFRATNEFLGQDDTMLTLRDIESAANEGEHVTVTGHTPPTRPWWLGGGLVALIVLGGALVVAGRRRKGGNAAP